LFLVYLLRFVLKKNRQQMDTQQEELELELAEQYFEEGESLYKKNKHKFDLVPFQKASNIFLKHQKWERYIFCLWRIALFYYNKSRYEEGKQTVTKALALYDEKINETIDLKGHLYYRFSLLLLGKRDLETAHVQVQKAIEVFQCTENKAMVFRCIMVVGSVYSYQYRYREALFYYFEALKGRNETTEKHEYNFEYNYHNISFVYYALRQYTLAKHYFIKSLRIAKDKNKGRSSFAAATMIMLGEISIRQGKYGEAEKMLLEVLNISKKEGLKIKDKVDMLFYLGKLYAAQNNWTKAHIYLEEAVSLRREMAIEADDWFVNFNLIIGDVHVEHCQWEKGREYYQKALEANHEKIPAKKFHDSQIHLKLAGVYSKVEKFSLQLAHFEMAEKCWYMAYDNVDSKDYKLLFLILSKKLELYTKLFDKTNETKYLELGYLLIPRINETVSQLRSSMFNETDSLNLNQFIVGYYQFSLDFLYNCYLSKQKQKLGKEVFYMAEKKKVHNLLSNLKNAEALLLTDIPTEKQKELQELQSKMVLAEKKLYAEVKQIETEVQNESALELLELQIAYHQLIKELEDTCPEYLKSKQQLPQIDIPNLQKQLNSDCAFIEYEINQKYIYTFCISKTEFNVHRQPLPSNFDQELNHLIDDGILGLNRKKYVQAAYKMYQLLIEPILPFLQKQAIQSLHFIPDAQLLELPFEALLTSPISYKSRYTELPYLLHQYSIRYHYSATLWAYQQKRMQKTIEYQEEFMGFAPVYHYGQIEDLPQTEEATRAVSIGGINYAALIYSEKEVEDIQTSFAALGKTAQIHLRTKANLQNFKERLQQSSVKYLHIAAHSVLNEDEKELVGILFSPATPTFTDNLENQGKNVKRATSEPNEPDMILYPNEISQLQLNSDLVFLSCCKSGVGKLAEGEGMLSINRNFLYSGVSNIVFTLFKIYDRKTPMLTQRFYEEVLQNQKTYAQALQLAKKQMIEQNIPPKYWSGFLLLGE